MTRFLSGISLFLTSLLAYAIDAPAATPLPPTNPTAIIIFGIIFVGGIGGYAWFMWKSEKKRMQRENEQK